MKTSCENNLNEYFEEACYLLEKEYTHAELYQILETGNVVEKQIAALWIDAVNDETEASILLDNLTGCDGKIREAVAYKMSTLLDNNDKKAVLFIKKDIFCSAKILADATIDINGNICKFVLNVVSKLTEYEDFAKLYTENVLNMIFSVFTEIDKFIYKDKKYVINKQLFKLYWCLEALKIYMSYVEDNVLLKILERASEEIEYTIRERVSQILSDINDDKFKHLKSKLKTDSNYYVRKALI